MSISRRKFLGTGTLALIAAGAPVQLLAGESLKKSTSKSESSLAGGTELGHLDSATFSRYLNTNFRVRSSTMGSVSVKLIEVNHWPESRAGKECFSLVFLGSGARRMRQDIYTIEHDAMGSFPLLVVPSSKTRRGFYYEVILNRTR
jgi:hypothetical protein